MYFSPPPPPRRAYFDLGGGGANATTWSLKSERRVRPRTGVVCHLPPTPCLFSGFWRGVLVLELDSMIM